MSKVSNVLLMLEYLELGKKYSIRELAELLEVSPRMIRVYKDECEKAGIFIDTIKGPYGGYVLNQKINMPVCYTTPEKIIVKNNKIYNTICKAVKERRKCFISYYDHNASTVSKREIEPHEMIVINNEWVVPAFCHLCNDIRSFYINRIKDVKIMDKY